MGLALCGAPLYKLSWSLVSGCSLGKASLMAGLWLVFSRTMGPWHNLSLLSSTLHRDLHKPKNNSTKQKNRIPAEYLQIFLWVPEGPWKCPFCRIWAWKQSCKESGSMTSTSFHTCTQSHFHLPVVISSPLFTFDYMWSAHSVKILLDWILKFPVIPIIWWIQNIECVEYRHHRNKFLLFV